MICGEFCELLDNYESLSEKDRTEMENHASKCETCRSEYEFFKSIISISSSIPSPKAPDTLIDKVNAKLDAEAAASKRFGLNLRIISGVAACLAIGLAVGVNNGYIKEHIENTDTDGVISEKVVSTAEEKDYPVKTSETVEETASVKMPVPTAETEKTNSESVGKYTVSGDIKQTAEVKPTVQKEEKPSVSGDTQTDTAETEAPTERKPEPTTAVDSYAIRYDGSQIAYGYYNTEKKQRTPNAISDYLQVESNDMGTVVSTMSEMGFKYGKGYYMTSRDNFYAFIGRLDSEGVAYECDLRYNSGDDISFRLMYN